MKKALIAVLVALLTVVMCAVGGALLGPGENEPDPAQPSPTVTTRTPDPEPATVTPAEPTEEPQEPTENPSRDEPKPEEPTAERAKALVLYANCTEVRAAGKAPLHSDEPGYARKLDRDGDGIACDK